MDGPQFIFDLGSGELLVQLCESPGAGRRYPVVASEGSCLSFDAALFMAVARSAEDCSITPVRAEVCMVRRTTARGKHETRNMPRQCIRQ